MHLCKYYTEQLKILSKQQKEVVRRQQGGESSVEGRAGSPAKLHDSQFSRPQLTAKLDRLTVATQLLNYSQTGSRLNGSTVDSGPAEDGLRPGIGDLLTYSEGSVGPD